MLSTVEEYVRRQRTIRQKYGYKFLFKAAHKCNPIFDARCPLARGGRRLAICCRSSLGLKVGSSPLFCLPFAATFRLGPIMLAICWANNWPTLDWHAPAVSCGS